MSPLSQLCLLFYYLFGINRSILCSGDCDGFNSCNNYGKCNFTCSVWAECTDQDVNCNTGATCILNCVLAAACNNVNVNAGNAESITVLSNKAAAAADTKIYCPKGESHGQPQCIMHAVGTALSVFAGTNIYAYEGFNDVIINECTAAKCGTITMHCTQPDPIWRWIGKPQCDIDSNTYDHCANDDTRSHQCTNYFLPSISPTPTPSVAPTTPAPTMINRAEITVTLFINNSNITTDNVMNVIQKSVDNYLNDTLKLNYTYSVDVILLHADYENKLFTVVIIISSDDENIIQYIDKQTILQTTGNELLSKYGEQIKIIYDTTTPIPYSTDHDISIRNRNDNTSDAAAYVVPIVLLFLTAIIIIIVICCHKKKKGKINEKRVEVMELMEPGSPNMQGEQNCIVKYNEDEEDEDMYVDGGTETVATPNSDAQSNLSLPVSQIDIHETHIIKHKTSVDDELYDRVSIATATTANTTDGNI